MAPGFRYDRDSCDHRPFRRRPADDRLRPMLIPLRTNLDARRPPRITVALILVNMLVYLALLLAERAGFDREALTGAGALASGSGPRGFRAWALITYQFLHDPSSLLHLAFNMLFLWIFGAAVEDRLRPAGFLLFYLAGGMVAGLGHMLAAPGVPVIGASGAVAAVTGAFIALFPRARVLVLFFFVIIGVYAIPAVWLVGLYVALDLINQLFDLLGSRRGNTAYMAHLAGYAFGFTTGMILLATSVVRRGEFDALSLLAQWRRRRAFRRVATRSGGGVWDVSASPKPTAAPAGASAEVRASSMAADAQRRAREVQREEIISAARRGASIEAAERLLSGRRTDPRLALPDRTELDLALALASAGRFDESRALLAALLERGPHAGGDDRSGTLDEAALTLAFLLGRHLGAPGEARALATRLAGSMSPAIRDSARSLLEDLAGRDDRTAGAGSAGP